MEEILLEPSLYEPTGYFPQRVVSIQRWRVALWGNWAQSGCRPEGPRAHPDLP